MPCVMMACRAYPSFYIPVKTSGLYHRVGQIGRRGQWKDNSMPTGFTHAIVGLGLSEIFMGPSPRPLLCGLSMALAAGPDVDILAFPLGIPYGSFFGHRGFFHSLFCAAVIGLAVALLSGEVLAMPWWLLWGYF